MEYSRKLKICIAFFCVLSEAEKLRTDEHRRSVPCFVANHVWWVCLDADPFDVSEDVSSAACKVSLVPSLMCTRGATSEPKHPTPLLRHSTPPHPLLPVWCSCLSVFCVRSRRLSRVGVWVRGEGTREGGRIRGGCVVFFLRRLFVRLRYVRYAIVLLSEHRDRALLCLVLWPTPCVLSTDLGSTVQTTHTVGSLCACGRSGRLYNSSVLVVALFTQSLQSYRPAR